MSFNESRRSISMRGAPTVNHQYQNIAVDKEDLTWDTSLGENVKRMSINTVDRLETPGDSEDGYYIYGPIPEAPDVGEIGTQKFGDASRRMEANQEGALDILESCGCDNEGGSCCARGTCSIYDKTYLKSSADPATPNDCNETYGVECGNRRFLGGVRMPVTTYPENESLEFGKLFRLYQNDVGEEGASPAVPGRPRKGDQFIVSDRVEDDGGKLGPAGVNQNEPKEMMDVHSRSDRYLQSVRQNCIDYHETEHCFYDQGELDINGPVRHSIEKSNNGQKSEQELRQTRVRLALRKVGNMFRKRMDQNDEDKPKREDVVVSYPILKRKEKSVFDVAESYRAMARKLDIEHGDYVPAIELFKKAIGAMDRAHCTAYKFYGRLLFEYGLCLAKAGHKNDAREHFARARAHGYSHFEHDICEDLSFTRQKNR